MATDLPPAAGDRVAAYLAEVRERTERKVAHPSALPISNEDVRGFMESAGDVPRLLAALEAVQALVGEWHNPEDDGLPSSALSEDRARVRAKCADSLEGAITAALLGESARDIGATPESESAP